MVRSPPALASGSASEDTTESHSYPAVQRSIDVPLAASKILRPSLQSAVESLNDFVQAPSVIPSGAFAQRFLESFHALFPRPFAAVFKVPPQKVETSGLAGVHDSRLFGVQDQSGFPHPLPHRGQGVLRLGPASALDDEVIRVARHLLLLPCHFVVQGVEVEIS